MKLEKKLSKINGFGIFTKIDIPKNYSFYIIPLDKIYTHPKKHCAKIDENKYVDDPRVLNWINHSCDPNSSLSINKNNPSLKSLRFIFAGEEITVDYNKTETRGIKIKCNCGSSKCRGYFNKF